MTQLLLSVLHCLHFFSRPLLNGQEAKGLDERINDFFEPISNVITSIVLYSIPLGGGAKAPVVVLILIGGALYFTLYFRFVNLRRFLVSINIVRGIYKDVEKPAIITAAGEKAAVHTTPDGDIADTIRNESVKGEVSHFQALTAALSATVGLGNIAGVAIAIGIGGPGATVWMILAGILGMSSKFVECTLGVRYRDVAPDGTVYGGPMYYLKKGFAERGMAGLGKVLAVLFAVMCIGGSLGGGNMFQANQAALQVINQFELTGGSAGFYIGLAIAVLVGIVILGGIRRIAAVAERVVPFMAFIYVGAGLVILAMNYDLIPAAARIILSEAFSPEAVRGGFLGVMIIGFQRAAFSNEAGIGSSAIAHSAVRTSYPASEGLVALLEPFIDTVVICTMSALVIVLLRVQGVYQYDMDNNQVLLSDGNIPINGVGLTTLAFENGLPGFSYVLTLAILLFAYSTMLSWSYYGLQSWKFLFGRGRTSDITFKLLFILFIVIGASSSMNAVVDFSDAMIFAMVFPNMIGLLVLAPVVRQETARYLKAIFSLKKKGAPGSTAQS